MEIKLEQPYGWLFATLSNGNYEIDYYTVQKSQRGQGFGKKLLQLALESAKLEGATAITGTLVSRESVHAAQAVFGHDSVAVDTIGEFNQDGRPAHLQWVTRATMYYAVSS